MYDFYIQQKQQTSNCVQGNSKESSAHERTFIPQLLIFLIGHNFYPRQNLAFTHNIQQSQYKEAYTELKKDLIKHLHSIHTGCLSLLTEIFGLDKIKTAKYAAEITIHKRFYLPNNL